jgi:hypothetical protein
MQRGKPTDPTSAVEFAVDLHAITVIAANNYQRCITALWRGYYNVQYYDDDRLIFGEYKYLTSTRFSDHFDTQRIKGTRLQVFDDSPSISKYNQLVLHVSIFGVVYDCSEYAQRQR